jgi:hypothetical protein
MTKQQVSSKNTSLEPHPEFTNICALKKHVIKMLSQLYCPQSAIHGWAGLAMDPATYQLFESTVFFVPIHSGPMGIYPQWAAPTMVKMTNATFLCKKNYFLSYKNIARACFRMFDTNIRPQFKVSNTPALTGWNSTMSTINILNQLHNRHSGIIYHDLTGSFPSCHLTAAFVSLLCIIMIPMPSLPHPLLGWTMSAYSPPTRNTLRI